MSNRDEVFEEIGRERAYQLQKWGHAGEMHEVLAWLQIMRLKLDDASVVHRELGGRRKVLQEIVQIAAVATACLEQHGAPPGHYVGFLPDPEEKVCSS